MYAFEGPKIRWDRRFIIAPLDDKTVRSTVYDVRKAFDGEKGMIMNLSRPVGDIPTPLMGEIVSNIFIPDDLDPRKWGTVFGTEVSEILRSGKSKLGPCKVEYLGSEKISNAHCEVIEVHLVVNGGTQTFKLWLNPQIGTKVVREKAEGPGPYGHMFKFLDDIEYKNYGEQVWFPCRKLTKAYVFDETKNVYRLYYTRVIRVSDDFKVNVDVPDSLFHINFIKGQQVRDMRTGKVFTWPDK